MQPKTKTVLVTGAGSGFGRAMAKAFCDAGHLVFGIGRRNKKLEETALICGKNFHPMNWDITMLSDAPNVVADVVGRTGALHVLVNNAAVLLDDETTLSRLSLQTWEKTWQTNVSAGLALTQAAFNPMRRQRYGRVAFVTSGLGFEPMLEYGSYCISKAAVNMMVRVFALDGKPDNVLVNAIDPGVARTEMNTWADEPPESVVPVALYLAGIADGGPTGKCFDKKLLEVSW